MIEAALAKSRGKVAGPRGLPLSSVFPPRRWSRRSSNWESRSANSAQQADTPRLVGPRLARSHSGFFNEVGNYALNSFDAARVLMDAPSHGRQPPKVADVRQAMRRSPPRRPHDRRLPFPILVIACHRDLRREPGPDGISGPRTCSSGRLSFLYGASSFNPISSLSLSVIVVDLHWMRCLCWRLSGTLLPWSYLERVDEGGVRSGGRTEESLQPSLQALESK